MGDDKALKCFRVETECCDAEQIMIIFARSSIEAKRRWANEHGDGDRWIAGISARRLKGWDKHAPGPVPALEMIEDGWWFECHGCGVRICGDEIGQPIGHDDAESEEDAALLPIMAPVERGRQEIYCRQDCLDREMRLRARKKHYSARIFAWMERRIMRRFPGATIVTERSFDRHIYITERAGQLRVEQVVVSFTWPTARIGKAQLRIDKYSFGREIPRNAYYSCCSGDREAFEAWAEEQLAAGGITQKQRNVKAPEALAA